MSSIKVLRPGFLVSLKTTLRGGISYDRRDLEPPSAQGDEDVALWETTRIIDDAEEHARAVKVRTEAAGLVRRVCSPTSFGLLCPSAKADALDGAIGMARDLADAFNEESQHTELNIYVLKGRVADNDEEATRALAAEIRGLLEQMERGIRNLDVKSIRDAANKARALGQMIDTSQSERVGEAIKAAREAARKIVKRVEKGGEDGVKVLKELKMQPIETARFAFLDDAEAVQVETLPGIDRQRFADIAGENVEGASDAV